MGSSFATPDGHILIIVWYMSVGSFQRPTGEDKLRSGYSHTKGSAGEGELGLSLSLGLASGGNRLARHRASQAGMSFPKDHHSDM